MITYEIANPFRDLTDLYSVLKSAGNWWHHIENVWIIQTDKTTGDWNEILIPYFEQQDNLFIAEITDDYQGLLPENAWKWLEKRDFKQLPPPQLDSDS